MKKRRKKPGRPRVKAREQRTLVVPLRLNRDEFKRFAKYCLGQPLAAVARDIVLEEVAKSEAE